MNLSLEDAQLFFDLMWGLQNYVNQQSGILENISSAAEYAKLPTPKKLKVRETLWKSPALIDQYVKENPLSLSPEHLGIILSWKGFIKGEFFILRHLKKYSVFIGNKDLVYAVLGLIDNLDDIVPSYALPTLVDAILLPFKGRIIYDGLLGGYNVSFGSGYRSDLNYIYSVAKQKERIITSLEPDLVQSNPVALQLKRNWLPQLEEMAATASKLKGETALQNAAFAMVRASLDMAKSVETNPDDLEALFAGEKKVRKAGGRLSTVLEIEAED
jgi:hypothetical protein